MIIESQINQMEVMKMISNNICQNCHWYKPNESFSHKIKCVNMSRDNWKGIEELNTCNDFILTCNYKPDLIWSTLITTIEEKIIKDNQNIIIKIK